MASDQESECDAFQGNAQPAPAPPAISSIHVTSLRYQHAPRAPRQESRAESVVHRKRHPGLAGAEFLSRTKAGTVR